MTISLRVLTMWMTAKHHLTSTAGRLRHDERGELTAGVIFLVALAVAAVAVAAIVVAKINTHANQIP